MIYLIPTGNRKTITIGPVPSAQLRKHAALTEPHPVGLFAIPIPAQPGICACMGVEQGKWVVVGFCCKGHRVPECAARGTISLAEIGAETNTEVQRIMIERYGIERYIHDSGAAEIQHDDFGALYALPGGTKVVRLINSTVADAIANEYWLPVPSGVQTAHEAVAWSFGLTPETYQPAAQS